MLIENVGICLGEYELQIPSYREEPIAAQHSVMTKDPTLCTSLSKGSNFFARWLTVPHTSDTARSWQKRRAAEKAFRAFRIDLNDQYGYLARFLKKADCIYFTHSTLTSFPSRQIYLFWYPYLQHPLFLILPPE